MRLVDWSGPLTRPYKDPHDLCRRERERLASELAALDAECDRYVDQMWRLSEFAVAHGGNPREIRKGNG